ncbi:SPFH domain-containing protein [Zavarzinia compransoris]|nr:SPFH domain-containing protein [Zavarzinia compransoris]
MDFLLKQFVDVIQWTEDGPGTLAYRFPMAGKEIQNGGTLVVRESQAALFINEGTLADKFAPGTHTLTTQTLPVLTYLRNWDKGFESPFKSDVYFFSLREQINQKWGTAQPVTVRDKEFGAIRIRAFGTYSYAIEDLDIFFAKLVGTAERITAADLDGQLKSAIITALATGLGQSGVAFVDMAANQQAFSEAMQAVVRPALAAYGLALRSFYVQSLSLPEELQAYMDKATGVRMAGDLQRYTQFQAAEALGVAAANPGGVAGAGAGMAAGLAMGQAMAQSLGVGAAAPAAPAAPAEDPIALLERLGNLVAKGILTPQEFEAKKAEILSRIR